MVMFDNFIINIEHSQQIVKLYPTILATPNYVA